MIITTGLSGIAYQATGVSRRGAPCQTASPAPSCFQTRIFHSITHPPSLFHAKKPVPAAFRWSQGFPDQSGACLLEELVRPQDRTTSLPVGCPLGPHARLAGPVRNFHAPAPRVVASASRCCLGQIPRAGPRSAPASSRCAQQFDSDTGPCDAVPTRENP
jgi:hypothetical protein